MLAGYLTPFFSQAITIAHETAIGKEIDQAGYQHTNINAC
jgi:hypothetical protein